MRITADVIDEEPCVECSDLEQDPPKCEKRLRLVVKGSPKAKSTKQYRFMFNTMLKKFKQLDVSDSFLPLSVAANRKVFGEVKQTDAMAAKDSTSASADQNLDQEWLSEELSKMKKEITKDVTKNVLHHLMGALKNTQDSITKEVDDSSIHKGIFCDNCDQIICGIRYKCGNCSDFDLCEACESIPDVHDGNHIFLKIRNPMPQQAKPKRRRKKVVKNTVYPSGNMHVTIDVAASKSALGKLATERQKMNAKFLHDITIPDNALIYPGCRFLKSWKVMNSGNKPWTHETSVNYMCGSGLLNPMSFKLEVPKLQPGEEGVVSVLFKAPLVPGSYRSHWGFFHKDEETFGDRLWCMITVLPVLNAPSQYLDSHSKQKTPLAVEKILTTDDSSDDLCGGHYSVSKESETKGPTEDSDKESAPDNKQELEEASAKQSDQNVNQVAEVLTAVHEVQERGEIVSRKLAAPSYTATPNNTPFDLSPPKSPEPHDIGNKDIQLGAVEVITGPITAQGKQIISAKSGTEGEDKASLISLSSSESDAEFVVIPMPKCFSFAELHSTEVVQPLTPEREPKVGACSSEMKLDGSASISLDSACQQNVKDPIVEPVPYVAVSEESTVVEGSNLSIETTVKLIGNKCPDSTEGSVLVSQITVDCSPPEFSVIDSEVQTPIVEVQTEEVESSSGLTHVECASVDSGTGEEQTHSETQNQDALSSGTYPKVPLSDSGAEQTVAKQEERTIQVLPEGLVTGALSAAATVYNTARAVISSMQVRNDQNQETEGPQQPESTIVPPHIAAMDPMRQLVEMGFCNRSKNEQLLQKHNGDVALVVAELVSMNDNDWYASRHSAGSGMTDFD